MYSVEDIMKLIGPHPSGAAILQLVQRLADERDAYRRAKAENDERYMIERDEARQERDKALADVSREQECGNRIAHQRDIAERRALELKSERDAAVQVLRDYPKGQDDGSWVDRKDAICISATIGGGWKVGEAACIIGSKP